MNTKGKNRVSALIILWSTVQVRAGPPDTKPQPFSVGAFCFLKG
jgi:hypothetical protein